MGVRLLETSVGVRPVAVGSADGGSGIHVQGLDRSCRGWRGRLAHFFDLEANADGNWLFLYTYGAGHMVGDWSGF